MEVEAMRQRFGFAQQPQPQVQPFGLLHSWVMPMRGDVNPGQEASVAGRLGEEAAGEREREREAQLLQQRHPLATMSRNTKLQDMPTAELGAERALQVVVVQTCMLKRFVTSQY